MPSFTLPGFLFYSTAIALRFSRRYPFRFSARKNIKEKKKHEKERKKKHVVGVNQVWPVHSVLLLSDETFQYWFFCKVRLFRGFVGEFWISATVTLYIEYVVSRIFVHQYELLPSAFPLELSARNASSKREHEQCLLFLSFLFFLDLRLLRLVKTSSVFWTMYVFEEN